MLTARMNEQVMSSILHLPVQGSESHHEDSGKQVDEEEDDAVHASLPPANC